MMLMQIHTHIYARNSLNSKIRISNNIQEIRDCLLSVYLHAGEASLLISVSVRAYQRAAFNNPN